MSSCQKCGVLLRGNVSAYCEALSKGGFKFAPIYPRCEICREPVEITTKADGGEIIVINGTCGAGKTTMAQELIKHGFSPIDGDLVMHIIKTKTGKKPGFDEEIVSEEIAKAIDAIAFEKKEPRIVLAHVVFEEHLERFKKIFETRNMKYRFIMLRPNKEIAKARCRDREVHPQKTPDEWVDFFCENLSGDNLGEIIDNGDISVEAAVEMILRLNY